MMNIKRLLIFLFVFALCFFNVSPTFSQNITELNKKRKKIEQNIKRINSLIDQNTASKNLVSNDLLLNQRKLSLKNQLIKQIENEILFIENQILSSNQSIDSLTHILKIKNDEFAQVIQKSFKNRNEKYILLYLLSAQSFNQAYVRLKFYKQIMTYQNEKLIEIKTIINQRAIHSAALQDNVKTLKNKQNERTKEANQLRLENEDFNKKIAQYKKKEKQLKQDLQEESKKAQVIENEIKRLIAAEASKRKGNRKLKEVDLKLSKEFSENYGLFPSPIKNGVITRIFGESQHPVLKKVIVKNNGIDINAPAGSPVYAIFDGEVSKIFSVPLSGMAIIVRHGTYMTVYSNLTNILVKVGDKVVKQQKLADAKNVDAANSMLHFELWNERSPENPAIWLNEYN